MKRAVVTGLGLVTSVGYGKEAFVTALLEGRSGVGAISGFDTSNYRSHQGGEVRTLSADVPNRAETFLSLALDEALQDAGIESKSDYAEIYLGTLHGSINLWQKYYSGEKRHQSVSDQFPPWCLGKDLWARVAEQVATYTVTTACTASAVAAGLALWSIRRGDTEVALICGVDLLSDFLFAGFDALRSLTITECKPFDSNRDGLVLGEGACVLVLESYEHAQHRNAQIYAELAGFATASDAKHLTAPDVTGKGAATAVSGALHGASKVDYINVHGTGTPHNDRMECAALQRVFGSEIEHIPVSSIKPHIGHTNGAAGVIEQALCLLAIQRGFIPPTLHHKTPDKEFAHFDFVANDVRETRLNSVLSMNSAFGGSNTALFFRRMS